MQVNAAAAAICGTAPFSYTVLFFFNDTATTEIYTLSLHDALPISEVNDAPTRTAGTINNLQVAEDAATTSLGLGSVAYSTGDRKSTRLNSSHQIISDAVFCLKKKKSHTSNNAEGIDQSANSDVRPQEM